MKTPEKEETAYIRHFEEEEKENGILDFRSENGPFTGRGAESGAHMAGEFFPDNSNRGARSV